jgi:hypothetical protein
MEGTHREIVVDKTCTIHNCNSRNCFDLLDNDVGMVPEYDGTFDAKSPHPCDSS